MKIKKSYRIQPMKRFDIKQNLHTHTHTIKQTDNNLSNSAQKCKYKSKINVVNIQQQR